jgi:hypothetical protein
MPEDSLCGCRSLCHHHCCRGHPPFTNPPALMSAACSSGSSASIPAHTSLLRPSSSAASSFSASLQGATGKGDCFQALLKQNALCHCAAGHSREPLGSSPGVVLHMLQELGVQADCGRKNANRSSVCRVSYSSYLQPSAQVQGCVSHSPILTCPACLDKTCLQRIQHM